MQAAGAWTTRVYDEESDEVEIDSHRGAEVLDLEVGLDDRRVEARTCADDDRPGRHDL